MTIRKRNRERERVEQLRLLAMVERATTLRVRIALVRQGRVLAKEYEGHSNVSRSVLYEEQDKLFKELNKYMGMVARLFFGRVVDKKEDSPYMLGVLAWIEENALLHAKDITETTYQIGLRVIRTAAEDGWGVDRTSRMLREVTTEMSRGRASRIARTEIHNASQEGQLAAAYSLNEPMYKVWVSSGDANTREEHAFADGQKVLLDEQFTVGGEALDRPGDGGPENAINCRCVMVFEPV